MQTDNLSEILTKDKLQSIFPADRSNEFFDALFGNASEGAYDIELAYGSFSGTELVMELLLHERPGCCLACNLTQGLPQVFSRHPIINVSGVVDEIDALLGDSISCKEWSIGATEQRSRSMHVIPVKIAVESA